MISIALIEFNSHEIKVPKCIDAKENAIPRVGKL